MVEVKGRKKTAPKGKKKKNRRHAPLLPLQFFSLDSESFENKKSARQSTSFELFPVSPQPVHLYSRCARP